MTRLIFHIKQHNKWSVFVEYDKHSNMYHVFGRRSFNDGIIFHTTFSGEPTTHCYLDEILNYTNSKRPNYSTTLFCCDLPFDAPFSEYEACVNDRTKEVIGYDYLHLDTNKVFMYLGFVRQDILIEEYK